MENLSSSPVKLLHTITMYTSIYPNERVKIEQEIGNPQHYYYILLLVLVLFTITISPNEHQLTIDK